MTLDDSMRLARFFGRKLPRREREQFVTRVLQDQELYNAFAEEQILTEAMEDETLRAEVERVVSEDIILLEPLLGRRSRKFMLWVPAFGLATLLIIIPFIVGHRWRRQNIASRRTSPTVAFHGKTGKHETRSPELALLLFPAQRSIGSTNVIRLATAPERIHLGLDIGSHQAPSFSAVVEEVGGPIVADFPLLWVTPDPNRPRLLVVELSSRTLKPGDYIIKLYRTGDSEKQNIIEGYSFLVSRE